jgi:hypothetical protein
MDSTEAWMCPEPAYDQGAVIDMFHQPGRQQEQQEEDEDPGESTKPLSVAV